MYTVRQLRLEKGWNQNELAFHADLAPSVISQVETGKREPSATSLRKLANALGVDVPDLFERDNFPKLEEPALAPKA
ncbi:MAG: helix-turn-helix transcriptional regulator [Rubrobacter sp.]|jgi:transcriptional regulator with XRE-family HTH domain|nr:helix-turn-helix transcriptional regulator [Rubrobacter sp.]MBA3614718.1 helix-turn-helix transcriptional regulator [Rubrobacteraceae bacterium]